MRRRKKKKTKNITARRLPITKRKNTTKSFQNKIVVGLKGIFGDDMVEKEWDVAKDSQDAWSRKLYCPRIDVAVRPFNTTGNIKRNNRIIDAKIEEYRAFIAELVDKAETEVGSVDNFLSNKNENPRCFLAIEIENSGTRKHMLGDIANASIIAAIGIVVPLNKSTLNGFKRIKKYIQFATEVDKIEAIFNNVLVINRDNFINIISSFQARHIDEGPSGEENLCRRDL